jgi:hypothetical protein
MEETDFDVPSSRGSDIEQPQMSEASTLGGVFFEPGATFEDLRRKPRFILALIILAVLGTAYFLAINYKIGPENRRRFVAEQIDRSPQGANLTPEQRNNAIDLNMKISSYVSYALPLIIVFFCFLGGLFYWLGAKAFGGTGNFWHGVSVYVYSSFPPGVVGFIANMVILAFKSVDDIDLATSQRGLVHANPGILLDGKAMPVLTTVVSTLDLFMIWGWVLAAIGLRLTNRLSKGSAWALVIIFALIGVAFRVIGAFFSGNPN